jgi:glycosyltransferase involved in cell wall biosynthesis
LLAQSYTEWECILVDDGSTDNPISHAQSLGDPRIRTFRLNVNQGCGAVRSFALRQASGKYLCMLDADDWMYPQRIEKQVDVLEHNPHLVLASAGMAVIDDRIDISGVRRCPQDGREMFPPMRRLCMPPVSFPSSMLRTDAARSYGFDSRFIRAEDVDLLLRLLATYPYARIHEPLYAYREDRSFTLQKILKTNHYCLLMFLKHYKSSPFQVALNCAAVVAKSLAYCGSSAVGCSEWLVRRRSRHPQPDEIENFHKARKIVKAKLKQCCDVSHEK